MASSLPWKLASTDTAKVTISATFTVDVGGIIVSIPLHGHIVAGAL